MKCCVCGRKRSFLESFAVVGHFNLCPGCNSLVFKVRDLKDSGNLSKAHEEINKMLSDNRKTIDQEFATWLRKTFINK